MKESEQLKVTDLRIGSRIREKKKGFEFIVTSIFWSLDCTPTEATIYADFKGNPTAPWEFELDEVELIEN